MSSSGAVSGACEWLPRGYHSAGAPRRLCPCPVCFRALLCGCFAAFPTVARVPAGDLRCSGTCRLLFRCRFLLPLLLRSFSNAGARLGRPATPPLPHASVASGVPRKHCLRVCRSADPLDLRHLVSANPLKMRFVLVNPVFEAPTREMRAALPADVPFKQLIGNSVAGGSLVRSQTCAWHCPLLL